MSMFNIKVYILDEIIIHPNADNLDLAVIGGFRSIVKRGMYQAGNRVIYIPTDAVIPDKTSIALGIKDYLVGKQKNRVKAIRLRGELSQGIIIPELDVIEFLKIELENENCQYDFADDLGITKYEEIIPMAMQGRVRPWPTYLDRYDIENVNQPEMINAIPDGTQIVATEKLHGTNMAISVEYGEMGVITEHVCSRKQSIEFATSNLYWDVAEREKLFEAIEILETCPYVLQTYDVLAEITLRGEVVGIQDIKYGCTIDTARFYAFDIRINNEYVDYDIFSDLCAHAKVPVVPQIFQGSYSYEAMKKLSKGQSLLGNHMREGIVVKPLGPTIYQHGIGRVQVKFVNEDYLVRNKGTELH